MNKVSLILALVGTLLVGQLDANGANEGSQQRVLEKERAANERAYRENSAFLSEIHHGRWVVIAGGIVTASFERLETAISAANRLHPEALHRFVFRPGVDNADEHFVQSPWLNSDPNWIQLGRRFRADCPLTITPFEWRRGDQVHPTADGRGHVDIGAPSSPAATNVRAVCSNLFEQDITITEAIADARGLERFSVPGTAFMGSRDRIACSKVLCRVKLDDLGIDAVFTAFVIPQSFVDKVTPKPKLELPKRSEEAKPARRESSPSRRAE